MLDMVPVGILIVCSLSLVINACETFKKYYYDAKSPTPRNFRDSDIEFLATTVMDTIKERHSIKESEETKVIGDSEHLILEIK